METAVTHVLVHDPQVLGGGVETRPHELDQVGAMQTATGIQKYITFCCKIFSLGTDYKQNSVELRIKDSSNKEEYSFNFLQSQMFNVLYCYRIAKIFKA